MASTNKTTNLELSQYVSSDKPTYLVDYNSDMSKIDTGVHTAQVTADTASTAASNAQTTAETAQTTANTAVTNAATAQSTANTANNNIGTLANLTTTEKTTIVGAVNELDEQIGNLSQLSTASKNTLVGAINEVDSEIPEIFKQNTRVKTNNVFIDSNNVSHDIYREIIEVNTSTTLGSRVTIANIGNHTRIIDFHYTLDDGTNIFPAAGVVQVTLQSNTGNVQETHNDAYWSNLPLEITIEFTID